MKHHSHPASWRDGLSVGARSRAGLALILLASIVAALGVWAPVAEQRSGIHRNQAQSRAAYSTLTAMLDQETSLRGFKQTREPVFRAAFQRSAAAFNRHMGELVAATAADDRVQAHLDAMGLTASRWQQAANAALQAPPGRQTDREVREVLRRKALMDRFRTQHGRVQAAIETSRRAALARAEALPVVAIALLTLIFGVIGHLLVVRPRRRAELGERRARRYADEQAEFTEVMQMTRSEAEANELLERHLERSLPDTEAFVMRRNSSDNRLEAGGDPPKEALVEALAEADPHACLAIRYGRTHRQGNGHEPLASCELCGKLAPEGATCAPALVSGRVIGSVLLSHPAPLAVEDQRRVRDSLTQAGPVLANLRNLARAELRAATDALTGLPNARAVEDTVKRMVAQSSRTSLPLTAVMLDLDHFKALNDVYGHEKGNEALAAVGRTVAANLRSSDFAGRYGGEEFLVLLPDTPSAGGVIVAEKLRKAISALFIPGVDRLLTASFGIASSPDDAVDPAHLVRAADRALYRAKELGRNRVEVVAPAPPVDFDSAIPDLIAQNTERISPPSTAMVSPVT